MMAWRTGRRSTEHPCRGQLLPHRQPGEGDGFRKGLNPSSYELLRLILRGVRQRAFVVRRQAVAPKRVDMTGNIDLRNFAVRSRGKIRHHVALKRQYLPILFRCPVPRLPGLPLAEKGSQPEYVGLISGRRAS